mgnify:CR=1 FL=1
MQGSAQIFFTRSGADDPNFNLRHEPAMIIRKNGKDELFINVIEVHGKYDPINEFSSNSYPVVNQIKILQNDASYSVAEIMLGNKKIQEQLSVITTHAQETFSGIRILKFFSIFLLFLVNKLIHYLQQ